MRTEHALRDERRHLADAERRNGLADGIGDAETARVAREFIARHGERIAVLERKYESQQAERALLQRDVDDLVRRLKASGLGVDPPPAMTPDPDGRLAQELDRGRKEAEAEARLAELKRRMGR